MQHLFPKTGIVAAASPYYPVGDDCFLYHDYGDGLESPDDHSIYGNHGTPIGGSFVPLGYQLDGVDDRINVVDHQASLAPHQGDYTIYAWFKITGSANWHTLLTLSGDNCFLWMLAYGPGYGDDRHWFLCYDEVDSYDYSFQGMQVFGNWVNVSDGNWHLMVYPIDRDAATPQVIDIDNVQKVSAAPMITNTYDWQNFTKFDIGLRQGLGGLKGIIGQILIFKGLKSIAERADYYNFTKARYQ